MMLKRITALLMCLMLMAPAALAASTRDAQLEEMTIDYGLQSLTDMVMGAAVLSDVAGLEENLPPSQQLLESLLALGLTNGALIPAESSGKATRLSHAEAGAWVGRFFVEGEYAPITESAFPGLQANEKGLTFDLSAYSGNPMIGAHIYSTAFDGERVEVRCDVYAHYDSFLLSAQVLPEDGIQWLCHGEMTLRYMPESDYGYLVESFILSPVYLDGRISAWQSVENTEFEYSVNLPSILGLAEDAPGHMAWQTADGEVDLAIEVHTDYQMTYDETLSQFLLHNPGQTVTEQREFSQFYAMGQGTFSLLIIPDGLPWAYTLTMSFPAERQAEFTLYAEFIRNSMIVWGLSNG